MSDDEQPVDDQQVRDALRSLRDGSEASLDDVLTLLAASPEYAITLVPRAAVDAVDAKFEMDRDVANGGMDQVAWNHGPQRARSYAAAFRTVGAIENADLLDRLAAAVEHYRQLHADDVAEDPVRHFLAYRKLVGGPVFQIPDPGDELAEPLVEYVIEHASELPDPDGDLPRRDTSGSSCE
jgi:hypothetical protein